MANTFLNRAGLEHFWGLLKAKFVTGVNVTVGETGAVLKYTVDGVEKTGGNIGIASKTAVGLMTPEYVAALDAVAGDITSAIKLEGVKIASNEAKIADKKVNLDFVYNSTDKKINLVDLNDSSKVLTSIDATAFIKDGMLDSAELSVNPDNMAAGTYLKLTFNTDAGKEVIYVNVTSLIDVYAAGNGLSLNGKEFSVKVADNYLTADASGLKVADALWTEVGRLDTAVDTKAQGYANTAKAEAVAAAKEAADAAYDAIGAAAQALVDAKAYVDPKFQAVNTKIGTVAEGKDVVTMISDAETAAKSYADTKIAEIVGEGGSLADTLAAAKQYTDDEIADLNLDNRFNAKADADDVYTKSEVYTKTEANAAFDAIGAAEAAKNTVIGAETDGAAANTIYGAKKYADSLASNYDAKGAAATAKSEVIGSATDAASADTIYGAKAYADAAIDAIGLGDIATGGVSGMINSAVADAKSELVGNSDDAASKDTIKGAKKHADEKAATAESNAVTTVVGESGDAASADTVYGAKAYADAAVTTLGNDVYRKSDVYTKAETGTAITTEIAKLDVAKVTGIVRSIEQVDGKIAATVGTVSYTELTDKPVALTNADIEAIVNGTVSE